MLTFILFMVVAQQNEVDFAKKIPAADWQVVEDPKQDIYDAVILESNIIINSQVIQHYRRIRVLSERGKNAAELTDISGRSKEIVGRVVQLDGTEIKFTQADLIETLGAKHRHDRTKIKLLVPPGLSDDCIVEMSWIEPAEDGLPTSSYEKRYVVPDVYFTQEKKVLISSEAIRNQRNYLPTQFSWTGIAPPATFELKEERSGRMLVYRQVPALQDEPYGNPYLDQSIAFVLLYKTFPNYGEQPNVFWTDFGDGFVKDRFNKPYTTPSAYDDWIDGLKKQKTGDLPQDVELIYNAFRHKFRPQHFLTSEERVEIKKDTEFENDRQLIGQILKAGYAPSHLIAGLLYKVLDDLEIPAKLSFGASVYGPPFNLEHMNPFTTDYWRPIVVVPVGESWLPLCPFYPEYGAGVVPTYLRGAPSIAFGKGDKWRPEPIRIERLPWQSNIRLRQYAIALASSGEATFEVVEKGKGVFDAYTRDDYYALPADERDDELKRRWQSRARSWEITEAKVEAARSFEQVVSCTVKAAVEWDLEGETWITFNPFPGDSFMMRRNHSWAETRRQPIILPWNAAQIDESQCVLPAGWQLKGAPSWEKRNAIGLVRMSISQQGNTLSTKREIVIEQSILSPQSQDLVIDFLAWVDEAMKQTLAIEIGVGS